MDLSIIIPCYNVEDYLKRCLASVSDIRGISYELILVDDGSTDGTGVILSNFVEGYSGVAKLIRKNNGGLSDARNVGMEQSEGQYIMFLDSDDYLLPDTLEQLIAEVKKDNVDIGYFDYHKNIDGILKKDKFSARRSQKANNLTPTRGVEYAELMFDKVHNFIHSEACFGVYKREFLNANGLRFEKGIYHEDTLFFYQIIVRANRVKYYNYDIYVYVIRDGSITTDFAKEKKRETDKLYIASRILDIRNREQLNCFFIDSMIVNYVFYTMYRKRIRNSYDLSSLYLCKKLSLKSIIMKLIMQLYKID